MRDNNMHSLSPDFKQITVSPKLPSGPRSILSRNREGISHASRNRRSIESDDNHSSRGQRRSTATSLSPRPTGAGKDPVNASLSVGSNHKSRFVGSLVSLAPVPPISPAQQRRKSHKKAKARPSVWHTAPINLQDDQHFKLVASPNSHHCRHIVNADGAVVAVVEKFTTTISSTTPADAKTAAAAPTKTVMGRYNIWDNDEHKALLANLIQVPAVADATVPENLRCERHYRLYTANKFYESQSKARIRRSSRSLDSSSTHGQLDVLHHSGDLISRPAGLLGRQWKHHLKLYYPNDSNSGSIIPPALLLDANDKEEQGTAAPKTVNYYLLDDPNQSTWTIKMERLTAATIDRPKGTSCTSPSEQEHDVKVYPGSDPLLMCLFMSMAWKKW